MLPSSTSSLWLGQKEHGLLNRNFMDSKKEKQRRKEQRKKEAKRLLSLLANFVDEKDVANLILIEYYSVNLEDLII